MNNLLGSIKLRLAGSNKTDRGRVEVFAHCQWGTVCDDGWDFKAAKVACRQLGFQTALSAVTMATFGEGRNPIWLDDVDCQGDEASLLDCGLISVGNHDCDHNEDAGVICLSK